MNDASAGIFPAAASAGAAHFDVLFYSLVAFLCLVALGIAAVIVAFCIRYRRNSPVSRAGAPTEGRLAEALWIAIPFLAFMGMYAWSAHDFARLYRTPANAMPVFVVAKQWMWTLQHGNGRREIDELHVPLGQPVRLLMTSQDVIHSFFVPGFRIKQDVLPGRYTGLSFTPTQVGRFHLFCAEYCGTDHAHMGGYVFVMPPAAFARWLTSGDGRPSLAAQGFDLYRRHGCGGCHEPGSTVHAPDLRGLFGGTVHLQDGRSVVADEGYLRDAVLLPARDVVAGYAPIMPSYSGQLDEEQVMAIVEYIRSLGSPDGGSSESR